MTTPKLRKAVFPVGGLGTRFLPATKVMPKEMLSVVDKPLIQYSFEEACDAGCDEFIFITGRNKNVLMNHFDHSYELQRILSEQDKKHQLSLTKDWLPKAGQIAFIRQLEPLGLGHAVWCARNYIRDEPFAVLLADEMGIPDDKPVLNHMVEVYEKTGACVIAVSEVPKDKVSSYGIIAPDSEKDGMIKIKGMVEKPKPEEAPSNLSIIGRYILTPEIFNYLEKGERGAGGEIQLTDAMQRMIADGHPFYAVKFKGERFDCGSRRGFLEANIGYALHVPEMKDDVIAMMERFLKKVKK